LTKAKCHHQPRRAPTPLLVRPVVMEDPYWHAAPDLLYCPTNVPGPGIQEGSLEPDLGGCSCTTVCLPPCVHLGSSPHYSPSGRLLPGRHPVYECNDQCTCEPSRCGNRVVQFGPCPTLQVVPMEGKGWAVLAGKELECGEFVCEYAGEVVGEEVARRRAARQTR